MIVSEIINRKYKYENKNNNDVIFVNKLGNNRSLTVGIIDRNLGSITYESMNTSEFINYAIINNLEFQGEIN
jgi:hypothetical protein